jgi:phosphopantothenoylcysteine decarboxylase
MNVLHGVTGSVATKVSLKFSAEYDKYPHIARLVTTKSSEYFEPSTWAFDKSYDDEDEWLRYQHDGKVLHIELTQWADALVIAPCSANTLAKLANGLCDNLLTCCARAWDVRRKPMIVAPAMNTKMWEHPVTHGHYRKLESWGIKIVYPVEKLLFCGDYGYGAMEDVSEIIKVTDAELQKYQKNVLDKQKKTANIPAQ